MIYLLYGEDSYLKEEFLRKVKKTFGELQQGINYIQLDENSIDQLIPNIETPAFGFPKKLIIIKDSGLFKKKNNNTEKIAKYLKENSSEECDIIFLENEIEKNELLTLIQKTGTIKDFEEQSPTALIGKIKSICAAYKVNIKENTAQYLIECCGTNMQDIINEIRKLIEFAGPEGTIQKEDVDALTIKKSESIIFDLTDNLGKKNIKEAIDVLHNLIYSREPEQRILIMLYGHFKKLFIIKMSKPNEISKNLKLKPNQTFLINKYGTQAKYFSKEELRKILGEFIYLDEASKNGTIDLEIGLESVLCRYCS